MLDFFRFNGLSENGIALILWYGNPCWTAITCLVVKYVDSCCMCQRWCVWIGADDYNVLDILLTWSVLFSGLVHFTFSRNVEVPWLLNLWPSHPFRWKKKSQWYIQHKVDLVGFLCHAAQRPHVKSSSCWRSSPVQCGKVCQRRTAKQRLFFLCSACFPLTVLLFAGVQVKYSITYGLF